MLHRSKLDIFFLAFLGVAAVWSGSVEAQTQPSPVVPRRPVVAVVLAGGGALGFTHIGVLEVLEEMGIPIDIVVGTSMGAVVGGAYASGYSPKDMEDFVSKVNWKKMFSEDAPLQSLSYRDRVKRSQFFLEVPFNFDGIKLKNGLLLGSNITAQLDRMTFKIPENYDFDRLPRRFRAVATDIATGEETVFSHGSLSDALRASMNLPAIFAPYIVNGHYYVDGFVVDNLPVDVAKAMGADIVIAVNFDMHVVKDVSEFAGNPFASAQRSMDIMVNSSVQRQIGKADVVLSPDVSEFSVASFDRWKDLIQRGREAAVAAGPQLQKILARTGKVPANASSGVYFTKDRDPLIAGLRVDGGNASEQLKVRQLFSSFLGTSPSADALDTPVNELLQTGSFDFVKVRNDPIDEEKSTLVVRLVPRSTGTHSLDLGLSYRGTYTGSTYSQFRTMEQIDLRELTGEGSEWSTEGEFIDTLRFSTTYYQPFLSWFFVLGNFEAMQINENLNNYVFNDSNFYANGLNTSGFFGVRPLAGSEISVGLGYERYNQVSIQNPGGATKDVADETSFVNAAADQRDSPVFPMEGFALSGTYRTTLPEADSAFQVFNADAEVGLSLSTPFSFFLLAKAGSDFSQGSTLSSSVPPFYTPTLADRRMFPGLVNVQDGVGNHVGALGIEIKYRHDGFISGLNSPVFAVIQMAVGEVATNAWSFDVPRDFLRGNVAAGLGIRFSDSFGLLIRVGENLMWSHNYPYCAVDFGSFTKN